jgi:purine-binding chemotaxis protein CheW
LAAFRLGEERFGASLSEIREFVAIGEITPIPCCPPHVLGCMNLRGEILPLFDIRGPLRVKAAAPWEPEQAIILSAKEISAGIAVDEVLSVVDLSPAQATDSPVIADAPLSPFLLGIARLEDGFLGIVNLPELLREGGLIVDEEV